MPSDAPIHTAAAKGDLAAVTDLVKGGADVNALGSNVSKGKGRKRKYNIFIFVLPLSRNYSPIDNIFA